MPLVFLFPLKTFENVKAPGFLMLSRVLKRDWGLEIGLK